MNQQVLTDKVPTPPGSVKGSTAGYTQVAEGTTDNYGQLTFSGLYSGFYLLEENIPDKYCNGKDNSDTYEVKAYFVLITRDDARCFIEYSGISPLNTYWHSSYKTQ